MPATLPTSNPRRQVDAGHAARIVFELAFVDLAGPFGEGLAVLSWADRLAAQGLPPAALAGDPPTPLPVGEGPLWTLLLLAAAGLIALEWATYHRRVTV